ncbi:MAG: hypothetical protein DHS20C16_29080 [Phycisphaerae bacterium]|nr:MAG: hypothetical protein DHS20C16_29080 [Phycisphaerae bacterium]
MTDGPDKKSVELLLSLYVDNELEPQERADFEKAMETDPLLRAEVELQKRIEASLRVSFDASNVANIESPAQTGRRTSLIRQVAAVLFFAVSMGFAYWQLDNEYGTKPALDAPTYAAKAKTMQAYYEEAVANDFEPGWACSGKQFEDTFAYRFARHIVLDELPSNVKLSGLGYANFRTAQTVAVFAHVDGEPVLLFAEAASATGELSPMKPWLYRHERTMEGLLMYEVSKFKEAKILDHISVVHRK